MSAPRKPTELGRRSWWRVLKRTVSEFQDDNLGDWAAALTYYAVLSIFPALVVLLSLVGLAGHSATQPLIDNVNQLAPSAAGDIVTGAIKQLANQSTAGIALILGLALALWTASNYVGAFTRASNAIYEVEEGRPYWKRRPFQIVLTLVMILLLAISAIAVVVTGPLAEQLGNVVGAGDTAVTVWGIAKWPGLVILVITMIALLYYLAPNVRQPGFRWITPGGILAVALWGVASAGFALYVANFGSYNKTYGSLGGVIVFLVWLWVSNLAILLGAEFNAELERGRELEAGIPRERTIALEPRDPADDGREGSPVSSSG